MCLYKENFAVIGINDRVARIIADKLAKKLNTRLFEIDKFREYSLGLTPEEFIKKSNFEYFLEKQEGCTGGLSGYSNTVIYMDKPLLLNDGKNIIEAMKNCYLIVLDGSYNSFAHTFDRNGIWNEYLFNNRKKLFNTFIKIKKIADFVQDNSQTDKFNRILKKIEEGIYEI